ncbi:MAG: RNA methyltransferase [Balneolales bacterium]|nr:RNA methyltransferase [Balneolales bacterium]
MNKQYPLLSKARWSSFRKLKQRKFRELEGKFLAEGLRTVQQIVDSGQLEIECIIFMEGVVLDFHALDASVSIYVVSAEQFCELADTQQSQGVVAVVMAPAGFHTDSFEHLDDGTLLVVDAIQDPGNMGALYRSAAWFGAKGFILGKGSVDLFNPKTVRSTAGALGSVPVVYGADIQEIFDTLLRFGWSIYLLDAGDGAVPLPDLKLTSKSVLVVGNEGNGIDPILRNDARYTRVLIPGNSHRVESLNAAISGSIALYSLIVNKKYNLQ